MFQEAVWASPDELHGSAPIDYSIGMIFTID